MKTKVDFGNGKVKNGTYLLYVSISFQIEKERHGNNKIKGATQGT